MAAAYRRIVLIGPSGAGKSTVARLLADRLGWDLFDTDEAVVREAGRDIATIFADEGEPSFRERERRAVQAACLLDRTIVAAGGGSPVDPRNAELLWRDSFVVALQARPETALGRLSTAGETRPLIKGTEPIERIRAQQAERAAVYSLADWFVRTDELTPEAVVGEIERAALNYGGASATGREPTAPPGGVPEDPLVAFEVRTATASYPIVVGWDILDSLGERMRDRGLGGRAFVISDEHVLRLYGDRAIKALDRAGFAVDAHAVPPGEPSKTLAQAAGLYDWLVTRRAERGDSVVALGGGVVGDLAGFVAATFLRGMPLVQVPTSLLAMVDASIGGKVAVDHKEAKNLIGAFYQPLLVFEDAALLRTLPQRDLTAGWAEAIKQALIMDAELLKLLEDRADSVVALDPDLATKVIARNVALKGRVVSEDEREAGRRTILNYGHTIAHGIEAATGYGACLHGEAVAVGMVGAAAISRRMGLLDPAIETRQNELLRRYKLPLRAPGVDPEGVLAAMALDKKVRGKTIRWVLLEGVGRPVVRDDPPDRLVSETVRELTAPP